MLDQHKRQGHSGVAQGSSGENYMCAWTPASVCAQGVDMRVRVCIFISIRLRASTANVNQAQNLDDLNPRAAEINSLTKSR